MKNSELELRDLPNLIGVVGSEFGRPDGKAGLPLAPLTEGALAEVTILCIDAAGHSEMMKTYAAEFPGALARYREATKKCVRDYGGQDWHWAGDGCICAFWGERRRERAVLAGLKVLHEMMLFNLDPLRNPLPAPLKLRLAANDGEIVYSKPEGEINAVVINEASKLESKRTRAGEFNIFESVYYALDSRIKDVFSMVDDGFRGQRVFTYSGFKKDEQLADAAIDEMINSATGLLGSISNTTRSLLSDWLDKESASALYVNSRSFYGLIDQFRSAFRVLDSRWSAKYRRWLISKTVQFATLEAALWKELKLVLQRGRPGPEAAEDFQMLRSLFITTHADQEIALERLRSDLEGLHGAEDSTVSLEERVKKLLSADDLDRLAAFVSLIEVGVDTLIPYLAEGDAEHWDDGRRVLCSRLWELADLLLIEERRHAEAGKEIRVAVPGPLVNVLKENTFIGGRFAALAHFMEERPIQDGFIIRKFRSLGIEPNFADIEIVRRAVVAAHTSVGMRFQAAEAIDFPALCLLATYPRTPLMSIWVIAERVGCLQSADVKMIFFDCIRPILVSSLESETWSRDIEVVGSIIKTLFKYEIFIEDSYFGELEAIHAIFRARASRARKIVSMEDFAAIKTQRAGITESGRYLLPAGLETLPKAVLRHLAKNGTHPCFFACYAEEPRIALEAVRHLGDESMIGQLIEYCESTNSVPCGEFIAALPTAVRTVVLDRLGKTSEKSGNALLERELRKRLSKADLEWIRNQRHRANR